MTTKLLGPVSWSGEIDLEGYRTYKLRQRVEADYEDGPVEVSYTPDLPLPCDPWQIGNDVDDWVWFTQELRIEQDQHHEGEKHKWWIVEQTATNRPADYGTEEMQDPLLLPDKVRGTFLSAQDTIVYDRFGVRVQSSSFEDLPGDALQFDWTRMTVEIEQHKAALELDLLTEMLNTVNDVELWGQPRRCVKLSNITWEKRWAGSCYPYYTRTLLFEINPETFDKRIRDQGTKALRGFWGAPGAGELGPVWILNPYPDGTMPKFDNPAHFERYRDYNKNFATVILDGKGKPAVARGLRITSITFDPETVHMDVVVETEHEAAGGDPVEILGADPHDLNRSYTVLTVNSPTSIKLALPEGMDVDEFIWNGGGVLYLKGRGEGVIRVESYYESDFTQLEIPDTL